MEILRMLFPALMVVGALDSLVVNVIDKVITRIIFNGLEQPCCIRLLCLEILKSEGWSVDVCQKIR